MCVQVGYSYEFHAFGSMMVGVDMEGSDRDINVQPIERLPIGIHAWMKKVADTLNAMGGDAGVTEVLEHTWKDIAVCLLECARACVCVCVRACACTGARGTRVLVESMRVRLRL